MAFRYRYLPMLRSKAGEGTALSNLTDAAKDRMMPVIHLVHEPPRTFGDVAAAAWANRPMALDGTFQTFTVGSTTGFTQIFNTLGKGGVQVMPSIDYGAAGPYLAAVQKARSKFTPGVLVKAKPNQLHDVANWTTAQGWPANEVDLVVFLTEIGGYDPDMLSPLVAKAISDNVPAPAKWRSLTLSSSAAPKDMGELSAGQNTVRRLDWRVWNDVVAAVPSIDYADFSTITPDLTDPPGYVMARATVSVRYTIDDYWLVLKGKSTTGKSGQPMTTQYRAHAKTLKAHPAFGGLTGCWGDDRIDQIAGGAVKAGGRPQWASYTASRHLSFIADRWP
jgi:hypothetical protein